MKKVLLIIASLLFISGCTSKMTSYQEISYSKLKEMLNNKESFILYIGSSECSHCRVFKYTIDEVITEYQVKVYYLNIVNFNDEKTNELVSLTNFEKLTPSVLFIKDGVENGNSGFNRIVGSKEKEYVVNKFKSNGYIE